MEPGDTDAFVIYDSKNSGHRRQEDWNAKVSLYNIMRTKIIEHTIEYAIHKSHVESQKLYDDLMVKQLEWTSQRAPENAAPSAKQTLC